MSESPPQQSQPATAAGLSDAGLILAVRQIFAQRRALDAQLTAVVAQVVERSRPSLGAEGLASRQGDVSAEALVANEGLITRAEASRLCRVARSTAERVSLVGERMPASYPRVAAAVEAGRISVDAALAIITNLDAAAPRALVENLEVGEAALVEFALTSPPDLVRKLAITWRDALDEDGVEPREIDLITRETLSRRLLPNGMTRYVLELAPLSAAHLNAAIDASVAAELRQSRVEFVDRDAESAADPAERSTRTIAQIGAAAITELARHGNACEGREIPLPAATIVVRMTLEQLMSGLGAVFIDGSEQPISAATARVMCADAGIIPEVVGGRSEVLDLGRSRRLFSTAQKLVLAGMYGGCAMHGCDRPPSYTEAHHLRWWSRGGASDLRNAIPLCERDHHRVHNEGWDLELIDGAPHIVPPATTDPGRTPRRLGRLPVPVLVGG